MSFLNPWFLAGLVAVGLPLWLHLLERQNPIRVPFSSLMFFRRRTERSIRHRRLRYLMLLAARLALLALLALAFARPVWQRPPAAGLVSARTRILAVDTSFSMSYQGRWDRAQREAMSLIDGMSPADRTQALAFGPGVKVLTEPTNDRQALRAAVASLRPSASRNSYGDLGQSLRALAQNSTLPVEVHVISDFQQSAMPGRFADVGLPANATMVGHNMAGGEMPNWCVESVKGVSRLYQQQPPRVEVTVAGFHTPQATRRVTLAVNGRQVASQNVKVPEAGRATVEFAGFDVPHGHSRAEVRIDSADGLPADDMRLFPFERADPWPILFLRESGRTREAVYYRTALGATGQATFAIREAGPLEAAGLPLEQFAFVILADVPRLPSALEQRLKSYVEAGGGCLMLIGPSVALGGEAPLLKRRLSDVRYTPRDQERFQQVGEIDSTHAALRGTRRFTGVKFFRYARLDAAAERVLARLSDGSPLLIEEPLGSGRLLVLTSTPDNTWNDLPVNPLFVPFVAESARYLSGLEETLSQATVDSVLELHKRRDPRATVEVVDPFGRRALTLAEAVSSRQLVLASTGFYEIRRPGRIELVAVNPDARESDLRAIPDDVLAMWKATGRTEATKAGGTAAPQAATWDVWRLILLFAMLVAVIESLVGDWHLRVRREVHFE